MDGIFDLDALQQRAAENAMARLALWLDAIRISAAATEMGPGAKSSVAEYLKYTTTTVGRLAAMIDLPDDCIDLELPLGTYWVALLHADAPVEFLRQHAIPNKWSPAEAKRALGVEVVRESRLNKLEAELDQLREERQEITAWLINEVHDFGSDIVKGVRLLLQRLREAEDKDGP